MAWMVVSCLMIMEKDNRILELLQHEYDSSLGFCLMVDSLIGQMLCGCSSMQDIKHENLEIRLEQHFNLKFRHS